MTITSCNILSSSLIFLLRFASNVPKLLDLCCGRGGDMHKWLNFRVGLSFCPFVLLGPS